MEEQIIVAPLIVAGVVGLVALVGTVLAALARASIRSLEKQLTSSDQSTEKELVRLAECIAHLEEFTQRDAVNLEDWKRTYVGGHSEVTGGLRVLTDMMHGDVRSLQVDVRTLLTKQIETTTVLNEVSRRLAKVEG